jgi:hypothetical protein
MIYKTFEQWKSGNVLEHGVPRTEYYSEDQLDLVEMGWMYGYDAGRAVEQALDKKAENARELGLDYEPAGLIARLKHPDDHYEFTDPKKANAVLMSLCQEAADALAAPVQEHVATLIEHYAFTDGIVRFDGVENMEQLPVGTKFYTTPPAAQRQWVALTDEERDAIFELHHTRLGGWDHGGDEVMYDKHFEDAVAVIEAKLKEKNAAAQPAVPDALTSADIQEHIEYVAGWNDCRQAMLEMMK